MTVNVVHAELNALYVRASKRFARVSSHARAVEYVFWLIRMGGSDIHDRALVRPSKQMQRMLGLTAWDIDGVRDDVRTYVADRLGSRHGLLLIGAPEFGSSRRRQALAVPPTEGGGHGNIGVFLVYASPKGYAAIDRELYTAESRTGGGAGCQMTGIPEDLEQATMPSLIQDMLERAVSGYVPFAWVIVGAEFREWGDVRAWLKQRNISYVSVIRNSDEVSALNGCCTRADRLINEVPPHLWRRPPIDVGTISSRQYSWTRVKIQNSQVPGREHWLLAGRAIIGQESTDYFLCYGRRSTTLNELANAASSSHLLGECLKEAKRDVGLTLFDFDSWRTWYAHTTLSMLGFAGLAGAKARMLDEDPALSPQTYEENSD
ncbi:transposase [Rhodococcus erythropolis]|uniref:IS701 family transposase n=1 Tax=Rhodococcus erythropolis TaxID=1833 RepID=UPI0029492FED|nr:transposase [Rhodococcus erythropolis]MDV6278739.1 transposase [Rhodococcus erythropolis]